MSKIKPSGVCHICGKNEKLSFEHIPPRSAFNSNPVKLYNGVELFNHDQARYELLQSGYGRYTLCESCNSLTGHWYATVYADVMKDIIIAIYKKYNNLLVQRTIYDFSFGNLPVICFAKQIVSMVCSSLDFDNVHELGFDKYLLNRFSTEINTDRFDLSLYLTSSNNRWFSSGLSTLVFTSQTARVLDLCAYPLGIILNLNPEIEMPMQTYSINYFLKENSESQMILKLPYLEHVNTKKPLPLQFK